MLGGCGPQVERLDVVAERRQRPVPASGWTGPACLEDLVRVAVVGDVLADALLAARRAGG